MSLSLLNWRRRMAAIYADVRAAADPRHGHDLWRKARDELMRSHPDSPIPLDARDRFTGLRMAPYDPTLRFEPEVDTDVDPRRIEVETATDGVVPFVRMAVVHLPGLGDLDVWWLASYGGGVFVPVKDATAGTATYGGGRYLLDTVKGADLGGSGTGWSSTSTSPTTRRAPTTRVGLSVGAPGQRADRSGASRRAPIRPVTPAGR